MIKINFIKETRIEKEMYLDVKASDLFHIFETLNNNSPSDESYNYDFIGEYETFNEFIGIELSDKELNQLNTLQEIMKAFE